VSPSHWSTSASGPHPGASHLTGGPYHSATWQSTSGPPHPSLCQMAQPQKATSFSQCHMTQSQQHTSAASWTPADTWQHSMKPPQPPTCHMSAPYWTTSPMWAPPWHKSPDRWAPPQCHMAQPQKVTSTRLCHMVALCSATSAAVNKSSGIKER
jgi:hypothetical protein